MPQISTIELPTASPGSQRSLNTWRYGTVGTRPKIYVQTGLHADENSGMLVMHHLVPLLNEAESKGLIKGEIILVPVANPVGLSQQLLGRLSGRFDFESGVNFNRGYAEIAEQVGKIVEGHLGGSAEENTKMIRKAALDVCARLPAETETAALKKTLISLAVDSDICLDLHCDQQAVLHLYVPEPVCPITLSLHTLLGSQATLYASVAGGMPFDEAVSVLWLRLAERFPNHPIPRACFGATVELRGETDISDEVASADAQNLMQFLVHQNAVAGGKISLPKPISKPTPLTGVHYVCTAKPGVVVFKKRPGDMVSKDEVVAVVIDPLVQGKNARHELHSLCDGVMYSRRSDRMARPGQIICAIAGEQPFSDKIGANLLTD